MALNWFHSMSSARLRLTLNWSGVILLLAGIGSAVLIWLSQDRIDRDNEVAQTDETTAPLPPLDSRRHTREVELYSGKVGVLMEEAEELFHGKALARTIAVVTVLTATGLFLVAARWPD